MMVRIKRLSDDRIVLKGSSFAIKLIIKVRESGVGVDLFISLVFLGGRFNEM